MNTVEPGYSRRGAAVDNRQGLSAAGSPGEQTGKRMKLRYAGQCRLCGGELAARTEAIYDPATRTVRCVACPDVRTKSPKQENLAVEAAPPLSGTAGASARREHERRKGKRDQRLRDKWGMLGGVAVAVSPEPQNIRAWEQGAIGEERLGARLDSLVSDDLVVLHDRRIPGTGANIDHLVVTRTGVWAIDAKRYKGRPELKIEGGILRPRVERLNVGRRDCTKLVDGVLKQVNRVRLAVPGILVTGAICFVEADWPLIGGSFTTRDVHVLWPKRLAKSLAEESAGDVDVSVVWRLLADRFPSA